MLYEIYHFTLLDLPGQKNQNSYAHISLSHTCVKPYRCMTAHVHKIKREHSEKETIVRQRKSALFNALMHAACMCPTMATVL